MPTPGQPGQRRTARNVGMGAVAAAVIIGSGVVYQQRTDDAPTVAATQAPSTALVGPLLRDGFEGAGGGAPVPPDACSGPLVKPAGFTAVPQSWTQMWTSKRKPSPSFPVPQMVFPNSPGFPVGIGAAQWQYQLTSFVPPPGMSGQLFFDPHQARPQEDEPIGRPAVSMFISISPCPGDFRPPDQRPKCSLVANTGMLAWTTRPGVPACQLTPNVPHYLLVAPVDPRDGSVAGDYTCRDTGAPYCWVQAIHRPL
jgi:hypothetical protein